MANRFPRYLTLLRLYPKAYRDKYADQMAQTLGDMLDDQPDGRHRALVWLRVSRDLPLGIIGQNALAVRGRLMHETPGYIRRSSGAGLLLVAPFFVYIIVNSLTNHRLYKSVYWNTWTLLVLLILLPTLAIIINAVAFVRWFRAKRATGKDGGFWHIMLDFGHSWPVLSVLIIALGIVAIVFGHDSVHCVGGNPIQELSNWQQTRSCIQHGFLGG